LAFPKPRSEEFEASRKQDGAAWLFQNQEVKNLKLQENRMVPLGFSKTKK
jgi:hypothetical protein